MSPNFRTGNAQITLWDLVRQPASPDKRHMFLHGQNLLQLVSVQATFQTIVLVLTGDCGWKIDGKTKTKRKARLNAEHDHLQVAFGNTPYRHSRKIRQTQMANCGTSLGYQGTHLLVTERHITICCLHWWTPHICWFSFVVWLMPFLFVDWLNHESTSMLDTPNASWCTSPGSYKCPLVSWHNSHLPCVDDLN